MLALVAITAGCPQHPSVVPDETERSDAQHPPSRPAQAIPRTVELESSQARERIISALGYPVELLGQAPVAVTELPFRDIVAFVVDGYAYCLAYMSAPERSKCEPLSGIDGHFNAAGEHLGFAIVSFTSSETAEVEQIRFVDGIRFDDFYGNPRAEAADFRYDRQSSIGASNRKHSIVSLEVDDIDGDGKQEGVAIVNLQEFQIVEYYYGECQEEDECPELADPNAFTATAYEGHRLLVFRENLTLEIDTTLDQTGHTVFDGWNPSSDDFLNYRHAFEQDALVTQWCEVEFPLRDAFTDCISEQACGKPTMRARWEYDPQGDAYLEAESERLRERVTDWSEDWAAHCPNREGEK